LLAWNARLHPVFAFSLRCCAYIAPACYPTSCTIICTITTWLRWLRRTRPRSPQVAALRASEQVVKAGSGPRAARRQQQLPPNVVVAHLGELHCLFSPCPACFACAAPCACCFGPSARLCMLREQLLDLPRVCVVFLSLLPAAAVQRTASRPSTCSAAARCAACTCPPPVSRGETMLGGVW